MRKLFTLLLISGLFSASCSKDKNEPEVITPSIEISDGGTSITLPETTTGEATISFTCNSAWQIMTSDTRAIPSWFDVNPKNGGAGAQAITVSIKEENTNYDDRTGYIKIVSGDVQKLITVTQKKKDALLVTKSRFEVSMEGGAIEVEVKANIDFSVDIKTPEWIHQKETRALKTSKLHFEIDVSDEAEPRQGEIVISSGDLSETITVYQVGGEILILTQNEYIVSDSGMTIQVEVRSNTEYTVEMPDVDWIKEVTTRGISAYTRHYEIAPNETYDARAAVIVFRTATKYEEVSISQVQKDALSVAKSEYEFDMEGGDLILEVLHRIDFDVTIDSSAQSWIIQIKTRGLEKTTLHFNILAFTNENERSGTIVLSKGEAKQTITVTQNGTFAIKAKEREALIAFYNATGGDNWNNNTNWCSDKPISEWEGIAVDNNGYVIGIYMDRNNLTGSIPAEIVNLQKLQHFRLPENNISGSFPTQLYDLHNLTRLALDHNQLTGGIPEDIDKLVNLQELRLNHNYNLSGNLPSAIGSLINLTDLDLRLCNLSGSLPESIENIMNNDWVGFGIMIGWNGLSGIIPQKILTHPKWQYLWPGIVDTNLLSISENDIPVPDFDIIDLSGNTIISENEYAKNRLTVLYQWDDFHENANINEIMLNLYDLYKDSGLEIIGLHGGKPIAEIEKLAELVPWRECNMNNGNSIIPNSGCYPINTYPSIVIIDATRKNVYTSCLYRGIDTNHITRIVERYCSDIPNYYTSTDYSADGRVTTLQKATIGIGIDIVLMGDAYSDRLIADGTYEQDMRKAMEYFFTEEPYKSHRNMFNVYAVNVVSKNEVYDTYSTTALNGYFGNGTAVGGSDAKCIAYAQKAITNDRLDDALIVVMMNSTNFGGTCYMYYPANGDHARGLSIAYFPTGTDDATFEALLHHEAGGHGFAKLADEYAYEYLGEIPTWEITALRQQESYGWWKNIDVTNNPVQVKWAKFLTDNRYSQEGLGIYEGAYTYWTGAYRPTDYSIMRYNTGGFNAPSREAIYYRIHKLAYGTGWTYDYETFVSYDAVNRTFAATTARASQVARQSKVFKPQTPPVIIPHSWREAK